jgi:hypothetical protein
VYGVPVALGAVLAHEGEALAELLQALALLEGPLLVAEGLAQLAAHAPEVLAVLGLLVRLRDDAELLDPGRQRLLADDLDDGLGQPVDVHQREHLLLDGGAGRILARATPGRGDDRFADGCQVESGGAQASSLPTRNLTSSHDPGNRM